ncbi:MAG TPA: polysaccharide deacetylase family protein [Terracidiphilus sp.]|jgi:peptidoglycan/xylan/chitin deacetylase (PgdA/CDA1 family)|nr:polysaccharide deacetylase family protein [Terracidiphilus sp.]
MLAPIATGVTVALGAAAAAGAYAALSPASQLFGKTLIAPPRPGELALTFDDGPNPAWTPRLLDILAAHNVCATFFMVGSFAQAEPALVRRVAAAGHLIGNHTWSHPNLACTASAKIREELTRTSDTLAQITGQPVRFFRPPFGARRPFALKTARDLGMIPVTWNTMTNDWAEPSAEKIASALIQKIEKNQQRGFASNIVLHDGGHRNLGANREPSVAAAGLLLARRATTHKFVTLNAWL